jgi:hypothetical protein
MWFHFRQNNSGGGFDINDDEGIGPQIWVEADDAKEANELALELGIYFDGCADGLDCDCCGDRWHRAGFWDAEEVPLINAEYDFVWHDTVYQHYQGGRFDRIKQENV